MITRRLFLSALAAAAADPEKLLWTPSKKLISIPKPHVIYSRQGVIVHSKYVYDPISFTTHFDIMYSFGEPVTQETPADGMPGFLG